MRNSLSLLLLSAALAASNASHADVIGTDTGKIVFTQGHTNPACRTVQFRSNSNGAIKNFRIPNAPGGDISAIVLAALTAGLNVGIVYDPAVTTGCGTEPAIQYITVTSP